MHSYRSVGELAADSDVVLCGIATADRAVDEGAGVPCTVTVVAVSRTVAGISPGASVVVRQVALPSCRSWNPAAPTCSNRCRTPAARDPEAKGLGKPETFDFLGFTHICGKTRAGEFRVLRKTVLKRRRTKLRELYDELKRRRHLPIPEQGRWLRSVAQGHLNYYAVPGKLKAVSSFIYQLRRLWMKALQRRSQKTRISWPRYSRLAAGWLPRVRNMHPCPDQRFAVTHPR